ncbi:nicotinamide riboside kinase-like protein 2 [Periconia macrospinosa]|uniref:Nicotinamide riboside kinase-like protein 2 n=1 Tax=Periconia macrospinosa TaxID=97972 RepID=A0A2V1EAQ6_9PLEO|nr:nicotinamide riboside kinase-like protein 2 [Periconia macrospinosa]
MSDQPPLLVGISGPSSSGKTTLSRLLRDIFPPSQLSILHLDDFYLTDAEIPLKNGVQDWDCLESLDLPLLRSTLTHIKEKGRIPPDFVSKEDQNSVGEHNVSETLISSLRERVRSLVKERNWDRHVVIVDGFLLFSEEMKEVREAFDVRLFMRTSYATAKRRREARKGYVTLEGFWEDPPGYVDQIVWPNYVQDHRFLFVRGDVEGELDEAVCGELGVEGMPKEAEGNLGVGLEWAVGVLEKWIR